MLHKKLAVISLLCSQVTAFAQQGKLNIGVQLNPIVHYNEAQTTGNATGCMDEWAIGRQAGIEINYNHNKLFSFTPFVKYYNRQQKIEQTGFFGYLNEGSSTWMKYTHEAVDLGLLVKYCFRPTVALTAGISYSIMANNRLNWGYSFHGDNPKTEHLGDIGFAFTPDETGTRTNMVNLLLGIRKTLLVKKVGMFEYGFLMYIPTQNMPAYRYSQVLVTDDNGTINSEVGYSSRQYSMEISIVYYLLNFNDKWRLVHVRN